METKSKFDSNYEAAIFQSMLEQPKRFSEWKGEVTRATGEGIIWCHYPIKDSDREISFYVKLEQYRRPKSGWLEAGFFDWVDRGMPPRRIALELDKVIELYNAIRNAQTKPDATDLDEILTLVKEPV
jgi:hypothetical protein